MTDHISALRAPLAPGSVHLCIDMQRLFAEDTPWRTPWMNRVLPNVERIAAAHAAQTIFTRFVPPQNAEETSGVWRDYWQKWRSMTLDVLPADMVDLIAPLRRLAPPALIIDKPLYSAWSGNGLVAALQSRAADTIIFTGVETDVCVLASVLDAVDLGFRVIVVTDAMCSSTDETHDALLKLYAHRYSQQVETATTAEILAAWSHH